MDNQRFLLWFTLFFITYLLWAEWQVAYGPKPVEQTTSLEQQEMPTADVGLPAATDAQKPDQPSIVAAPTSKRIRVITDVLDIELDTSGADIRKATLRDYAIEADEPEEKFVLMNDQDYQFHVTQTGLVSKDQTSAPTHNALYATKQDTYRLAEGEDRVIVPFVWRNEEGVEVVKTYTFKRDSYVVDLRFDVTSDSKEWSGSQYLQIARELSAKDQEHSLVYTYTGGVVYNDELKYEKVDFDDMREGDLALNLNNGWVAMIQHYFLSAWIPEQGVDTLYYTRNPSDGNRYIIGTRGPAKPVVAGGTASFSSQFVVGPKLQDRLETTAPGLELTVDYGIFTIFAKPLFWLLAIFHDWTDNWGWSIILLTLTVKAVFYKLSEMSYRSMAKMRKVTPRIKAMKERYGDDRQAMSKAMMDMYKREKINPLGGCFPILVQMPVFISLYWVLLESVEMRHAPFIGWLNNLSAIDPYFILPVLMGVTMFVQQKLNPAPIDPVQAKVFQIMPFMFTVMFAFFPSGLVLYWFTNNVLSIVQQYIITKRIESE